MREIDAQPSNLESPPDKVIPNLENAAEILGEIAIELINISRHDNGSQRDATAILSICKILGLEQQKLYRSVEQADLGRITNSRDGFEQA